MLQRVSCLLIFLLLGFQVVMAQDGKISGTIKDEAGQPIPYATILVYDGELFVNGARSDEEGKYSISPIEPGTYMVKAKYLNLEKEINEVPVRPGQTRFLDISFALEESGSTTEEVVITEYKVPVFEKDAPSGQTISGAEVNNIGTRDISTLAAITPGVYQSDEGNSAISIRGARTNATVYYIDGQKVRGGSNLPQSAISTLQVITGGTPAEFGDFVGGVVSITTAKPSTQFTGGAEVVTSQFLDNFGRNLAAINFSGPLITKKEEYGGEIVRRPVLGYFIAAEGEHNEDRSPTFAGPGLQTLNDPLMDDFEQTPLELSGSGRTFLSRANFVTNDDFVPMDSKPFLEQRLKVLARLDFQPAENILIKVGGNVELSNQDLWSTNNMMFALRQGNGNFQSNTYRGWVRFQQSFKGGDNSVMKNFFYSIQADYSRYQRIFQNEQHNDRVFDYGHVGKFTYDRIPFYSYVDDPLSNVSSSPHWITAGYGFRNLQFDPSDTHNQLYANYNTQIFDQVSQNGIVNPFRTFLDPDPVIYNLNSLQNLAFVQGILNGRGAPSIYGMYSGIGNNYPLYARFEFDQFRVNGQATAEIKGHNLKAGFEFEQRVERFYQNNASGLWNWMRLYTNRHFANSLEDDPSTYQYVYRDGVFQDTVNVPNLYVENDQSTFDKNLRAKLGLPVDGTDYINIDEYGPDFYSMDMFSADELLADGLGPVDYYGYTYQGQRADRVDPGLFFTDTENRPQNPYSPTYLSAYIQDKFEFEDIIFNLGLRVDRFDANQPVLKDPFSLYPTFTASETASILGTSLPGGVGSDWVAYVDDASNPTDILGYRSGETWYDNNGAPTSSNSISQRSGGQPKPHIKDDKVSMESFKDYEPQTIFMPRISFSFPISDVALFFAHYDVLAQRPGQLLPFQQSQLAGQLSQYAFLENRPTIGVTNPSLAPELTIDYEVGFRQKLGDRMALSVQGFYREQTNLIRFRRFVNAYPFTYDSQDNLDYGTVKGLTMSFDMRRVGQVQLRASYTLQFSNATSGTAGASRSLASSLEGVDILRVPVPTGFDQRHRIVGVIDYRYFGRYMGPGIKIGKKIWHPFKESGANLTMTLGSGVPYSRTAFALPTVVGGTPVSSALVGTINGSRLPATFRADLRIDKAFEFGGKTKADGVKTREYRLNFYLLMLNLFNTRNWLNVYSFTGLPDDDGYLASDVGQRDVQVQISPESYADLYSVKVQNPFNFVRPRTIQLGMNFNF